LSSNEIGIKLLTKKLKSDNHRPFPKGRKNLTGKADIKNVN